MQTAGAIEPLFEIIGNFFKVTLFPTNGGVSEGVSEGITKAWLKARESQRAIIRGMD